MEYLGNSQHFPRTIRHASQTSPWTLLGTFQPGQSGMLQSYDTAFFTEGSVTVCGFEAGVFYTQCSRVVRLSRISQCILNENTEDNGSIGKCRQSSGHYLKETSSRLVGECRKALNGLVGTVIPPLNSRSKEFRREWAGRRSRQAVLSSRGSQRRLSRLIRRSDRKSMQYYSGAGLLIYKVMS